MLLRAGQDEGLRTQDLFLKLQYLHFFKKTFLSCFDLEIFYQVRQIFLFIIFKYVELIWCFKSVKTLFSFLILFLNLVIIFKGFLCFSCLLVAILRMGFMGGRGLIENINTNAPISAFFSHLWAFKLRQLRG